MKKIALSHIYHEARAVSYDQFKQQILVDLTGKPITEEIFNVTPVVVANESLPVVLKSGEMDIENDFKDWLAWNDQDPPKEDDPDYYTYHWGMQVWKAAVKYYTKRHGS